MATYVVPKDLRAKPQIIRGLGVVEFFTLLGVGLLGFLIATETTLIAGFLRAPFVAFNIAVVVFLIMPSRWNRGKRNWQSIYFAIIGDKFTYHAMQIPDESKPVEDVIIKRQIDEANDYLLFDT